MHPLTLQHMWPRNIDRNLSNELRNQNDFTAPRVNSTFFTKFPLFTFPKAWNQAGTATYYFNFTTFKIFLSEELFNNNYSENFVPTTLPPPLTPNATPTHLKTRSTHFISIYYLTNPINKYFFLPNIPSPPSPPPP